MIEVHVITDEGVSSSIKEKYGFHKGDTILTASENGEEVGYAAVRMCYSPTEAAVNINGLYCPDADFGEMLVRAAVSYGERRGAEVAYAVSDAYGSSDGSDCRYSSMLRAGLRLNDGVMSVPVSNVVHMCRNCAESGK